MRTKLLPILLEPLLILNGMSSMAAVLAPDDHTLTQTALTQYAQLVAPAVALGTGFLAPPTRDVVAGVAFSDVGECLAASLQDGVGCHLVQFEVVKQVDVGHEDATHKVLGDKGSRFIHETDSRNHCRLQLILIHQFLQHLQQVDLAHWLHQLLTAEYNDAVLTDFTLDLHLLLIKRVNGVLLRLWRKGQLEQLLPNRSCQVLARSLSHLRIYRCYLLVLALHQVVAVEIDELFLHRPRPYLPLAPLQLVHKVQHYWTGLSGLGTSFASKRGQALLGRVFLGEAEGECAVVVEGDGVVVLGVVGVVGVISVLCHQHPQAASTSSPPGVLLLEIGSGEEDGLLIVHLPAVDGPTVPPIHIADPVPVLQVVEEDVLLRVFTQHAEVVLLGAHPVEGLDEGVVGEGVGEAELFSLNVEYPDFLGDGRRDAGGGIGVPLHPDPLQLVVIDLVAADGLVAHAAVGQFQLGGRLDGQVVVVMRVKLQVADLGGFRVLVLGNLLVRLACVPLQDVVFE